MHFLQVFPAFVCLSISQPFTIKLDWFSRSWKVGWDSTKQWARMLKSHSTISECFLCCIVQYFLAPELPLWIVFLRCFALKLMALVWGEIGNAHCCGGMWIQPFPSFLHLAKENAPLCLRFGYAAIYTTAITTAKPLRNNLDLRSV